MQKERVCRTCLQIFPINTAIYLNQVDDTDQLSLREKLLSFVPELTVDIVNEPIICNTCGIVIALAYKFKNQCLESEKILYRYIKQRNQLDLLSTADLLRIAKKDVIGEHSYSNAKKSSRNGYSTTSTDYETDDDPQTPLKLSTTVQSSLGAVVKQAKGKKGKRVVAKKSRSRSAVKGKLGRRNVKNLLTEKYPSDLGPLENDLLEINRSMQKQDLKNKRKLDESNKSPVRGTESGLQPGSSKRMKVKANGVGSSSQMNTTLGKGKSLLKGIEEVIQKNMSLMKSDKKYGKGRVVKMKENEDKEDEYATEFSTIDSLSTTELNGSVDTDTPKSARRGTPIKKEKQLNAKPSPAVKTKVPGDDSLLKKGKTRSSSSSPDKKGKNVEVEDNHFEDDAPVEDVKTASPVKNEKQKNVSPAKKPSPINEKDSTPVRGYDLSKIDKFRAKLALQNQTKDISFPCNASSTPKKENRSKLKAGFASIKSEPVSTYSRTPSKFPKIKQLKKELDETPVNALTDGDEEELDNNLFDESSLWIYNKENKRYLCKKCDKSYIYKSHFNVHLKSHIFKKMYSCPVCGKSFSQPKYLEAHSLLHKSKPGTYRCHICSKYLSASTALKRHYRIHTGEKPYPCEVCNKRFTQRIQLEVHLRVHTGYKPFKCNTCDASFSQKSHLTGHVRLHTGEKPYKCEKCPKSFRKSYALRIHQNSHNVKPFQCELCNFLFKDAGVFGRHVNKHLANFKKRDSDENDELQEDVKDIKLGAIKNQEGDGNESQDYDGSGHPCEICNKRFTTRFSLKRHMKMHTV